MSADDYAQFSDYKKAEHLAAYCKMHGIRQRRDSGSVLDFVGGGDEHSKREKELLSRYEKYGASWRLWSNPAWWDYKLKQELLELGRAGRTRPLWAILLRREVLHGAEYRQELEDHLRAHDAWLPLPDIDREWLADQEVRHPGEYAPPPPPEA
ncbi:hypothetical protein KBY82_07400 [Cyanobium sp. AMD-g]|uniref:hypothetical protein n=1 Tax=Cyanobium sp. AMD-g TaxID=2823699 RepID=UPI0020CC1763|nr:hypothetical protein [Cyanobium sp. AMD-g]MCP9930604.1 hypothetical protein [Cyanobium sp. AMD-g]